MAGRIGACAQARLSLDAAPDVFEALAQNRPGYVRALFYPNGKEATARNDPSHQNPVRAIPKEH